MPELPEVETIAADLRGLVVGAQIAAVACPSPASLVGMGPDQLAAALVGRTIDGVGRRGKWLVFHLSDGRGLLVHLRMTGQLLVVPAGLAADPYLRLQLVLADRRELWFRDVRRLGRIVLAGPASSLGTHGVPGSGTSHGEGVGGPSLAPSPLAGLGPEPLDPRFRASDLARLLGARRGRLKPLLLDQGFLAGIGNIYADEALWRARLHPLRTAASLSPAEVRRLHRAIRTVLREGIARRGASVDDYTAPAGDGAMQDHLAVYGRAGRPCPRCGVPIQRIVVSGRGTHLCPRCQRLDPGALPLVGSPRPLAEPP
jgi:formamidopyrimidine-DNA glycosylase